MNMRFDVVTLFPGIFSAYLGESLIKKAIDRGIIDVRLWDLRDWATGKHRKVDDRPYGGGPGMVIQPGPVFDCIEALEKEGGPAQRVLLSPQGERWTQALAMEWSRQRRLILLCGRYEGFDERVRIGLRPREISIGDYVTNGGEVAAMVVIDVIARLVPGFLGDEHSAMEDSFSQPGWIEYPQYTRPPDFRGMTVPEVLLSGDHQAIARWRAEQARLRSEIRQPERKG